MNWIAWIHTEGSEFRAINFRAPAGRQLKERREGSSNAFNSSLTWLSDSYFSSSCLKSGVLCNTKLNGRQLLGECVCITNLLHFQICGCCCLAVRCALDDECSRVAVRDERFQLFRSHFRLAASLEIGSWAVPRAVR